MYSAINLVSKTAYKNGNADNLNYAYVANRYKHNVWLTFNQARSLGACVKKGERGMKINFFSKEEKESKSDKDKVIIKFYTVFNVAQCERKENDEKVALDKFQLDDGNTIDVEAVACLSPVFLPESIAV